MIYFLFGKAGGGGHVSHWGTMFVQVFETVDYLTFHLPWGLEIFTESVFMYEICCLKIIERESKICVLGT